MEAHQIYGEQREAIALEHFLKNGSHLFQLDMRLGQIAIFYKRTELPLTKTLTNPNDIAFREAFLNPVVDLKLGDTVLMTAQGEPPWNTHVLFDGTYAMTGKVTKQYFTFKPVMGSQCTQTGEDQSSAYCHTCHTVER